MHCELYFVQSETWSWKCLQTLNFPKHIPNSDYLGSPLLWWKCQCFKIFYPTPVQTSSNTTAWTLDKYGTNAHDAFFYVEVRRTQSVKTQHTKKIFLHCRFLKFKKCIRHVLDLKRWIEDRRRGICSFQLQPFIRILQM